MVEALLSPAEIVGSQVVCSMFRQIESLSSYLR
ncbi:hypothetical protein ANCCAN_19217 [Ancylostoma caninum]|uniref:Uncharacterized protein n=1 Tax=Ancylostoma caninum TaxID=29170 RepID=A0A368FS80_ANCCA|nr:hypothetical protein ANCCAN_19217 [Ancylostoma caninum]